MWMYNTNYLMHYDKGYKKAGHKYVSRTMGKNGKWIYDYGSTSFGSPSKSYEEQKKHVESEMSRMEQEQKDMQQRAKDRKYISDESANVPRNMAPGKHAYQVEADIRRRTAATPNAIRQDKDSILDAYGKLSSSRQKVVNLINDTSWVTKTFDKKNFNKQVQEALDEFYANLDNFQNTCSNILTKYGHENYKKYFSDFINNRAEYDTTVVKNQQNRINKTDEYISKMNKK